MLGRFRGAVLIGRSARWLTIALDHAEVGEVETVLTEDERRAVARRTRAASLEALRQLGGEARREDIRRRALDLAAFSSRELAAPPPPKAQHKFRSLVDHSMAWALTDLKRAGLVENPRWSVWRLAGSATSEVAVEQRVSEHRLRELRAMSHPAFLSTPEWRATRAATLKRAGNRCQLDATHAGPLEVHHSTYERKGVELASDLVVLCGPCHRRHHAEPAPDPVGEELAKPFVVPLEWAASRPAAKPSLLKRLFAR